MKPVDQAYAIIDRKPQRIGYVGRKRSKVGAFQDQCTDIWAIIDETSCGLDHFAADRLERDGAVVVSDPANEAGILVYSPDRRIRGHVDLLQIGAGQHLAIIGQLTCRGSFIQPRPEPGLCLRRSAQGEQSPDARSFHLAQRGGRLRWSGSAHSRPGSGSLKPSGAFGIVVYSPGRDHDRGMSRVAEHGLVEQLVAHPTVETFDEPFCIGLPGAM